MYKSVQYIRIVAKNTFGQKKKLIFQMINHSVFLLFSIYLYQYVYQLLPSVSQKLPFPNAIWSMSMYFVVFWFGLRNIQKTINQDILSGKIETFLLQPMHYLWQKTLSQIGEGLIPFFFGFTVSVIVNYFLVGLPVISTSILIWLVSVFVIFVLSQMLTLLIHILCGLAAFWVEDSEPIYFVVSKLIMIFGGAWVPIAFFPKYAQLFAQFSPFGASMALSSAMYPDFITRFSSMTVVILFWNFVCFVLVHVISKRAFRRLSVNG